MNKQQQHKSKKRRKGQVPAQPQAGGGDDGVRITFLVNVWLGTGQLPEINEFDAASFRQELLAELDRLGATSGGQQREGREAVREELRLFDDVSVELFADGGGAAAAATGLSKKDRHRGVAVQSIEQLALVSTSGGSMPTVGLSFGTDKASFEIWIPCPTLRAGSSEVLYAGAHAEHMQGAECVVTRCA